MIEDSTGKKFVGLLTDGSASEGISKFFTSTGPPAVHSDSILPSAANATYKSNIKGKFNIKIFNELCG